MLLTQYEQEMLDGKHGWGKQLGMEINTQLGNIYGAERMIPIQSVHMVNSSVLLSGNAVVDLIEEVVASGAKFAVPVTLNPASIDYENWKELGFAEDIHKRQVRLTKAYQSLGGVPLHSCTPYLGGNIPNYKERVAWGESSAVCYINSVIGARTNRFGGPAGLAAGLTGVVPEFGYYLDENRLGQYLIQVDAEMNEIMDFGLLGYYVGEIVTSGVPVFNGLSGNVSKDGLKMLCAALASSGSVAMFHVVGCTPEAPTLEAAFGGKEPVQVIHYGPEEAKKALDELNKHNGEDVGIVVVGCPHCSLEEIGQVAHMLEGKRIKDGIEFWVEASVPVRALAERAGYTEILTSAGAQIVSDTCPVHCFEKNFLENKQFSSLATNSAKLAHYVPGSCGISTYCGTLEQCVRAALTGRFVEG